MKIKKSDLKQIIKESVKEVLSENQQVLTESSLNRIIYWIQNLEIALITAFRGKKENVLHDDLKKDDDKPFIVCLVLFIIFLVFNLFGSKIFAFWAWTRNHSFGLPAAFREAK